MFLLSSFIVEKSAENLPVLNSFSNIWSATKLLSLSAIEEGIEKELSNTMDSSECLSLAGIFSLSDT